MNIDITKTLRSASQIKLGAGVVGKVSSVLIVFCVTLGGIAALSRNHFVTGGVILAIFVVVFVMLWRLVNFADKNPQAAILEGTEFLKHEKIMFAQKGSPERPVLPNEIVPAVPLSLGNRGGSELLLIEPEERSDVPSSPKEGK